MSDYSAETPIEQTGLSGALARPTLLPWVLFGVAAGMLVAVTFALITQLWAEGERAGQHAQVTAKQTARADKAELGLRETRAKLGPLEEKVQALTTERDELAGKVKALTQEAAKATAAAAKATAAAERATADAAALRAAAKQAAKKKPVKKRRR